MDSLYLALNCQNIDYTKSPDLFFNICQNELDYHAPRKKKYIRGNNKPFMTKALSSSPFRDKFWKNATDENGSAYTRQ